MDYSVKLPVDACKRWSQDGSGYDKPSALSAQCPFCGDWSAFTLTGVYLNTNANILSAVSACPGCDGKPAFMLVYHSMANALRDTKPYEIRMTPASSRTYEAEKISVELPEQLRKSFEDTVRAYNSRIYGATATSGRRTLEGIFKYLVPKDKRRMTLYKLIEYAEQKNDFAEPLKRLSKAIRDGGNLGAHFDFDNEPDEIIARNMVELLEYLITYLYVLPKQIERLEMSLTETLPKDEVGM